jgi:hypothetical protein
MMVIRKPKEMHMYLNPRKELHKGGKNLGRFFVSRKVWKPHPHLALPDYERRKEHLPCNKESRH